MLVCNQTWTYCRNGQMTGNALKCQHISFCGKQVQINFNYMICNEVVKQVDSIKYLGVIINKKITRLTRLH